MRFLCLHGMGTSAKIFEMQTAAIRYELGDHHSYDFVEGNVPCEVDPSIKTLMPNVQEGFAYFEVNSTKSALKAYDDFNTFLKTDGPYDGVIAFSQSVPLVSSWMIEQVRQGRPIESSFKCAVFFSTATLPYDLDALQNGGIWKTEDPRPIIDIPTAHIWGETDSVADRAKDFTKFCKFRYKIMLCS
ncbi:hypothetical protein ACMFMF_007420 [Clarireedia jacksonii]